MRRTIGLGIAFVVAGLVVTAAPASAVPRCFGEPATIVAAGRVTRGTPGNDVILGFGGSDTIFGGGGNDRICGGDGIDFLYGGEGRDRLAGEHGAYNSIFPGPGDDFVDGGTSSQDDVEYVDATGPIRANLVTETVSGSGRDTLRNVEWLIGGPFDDVLKGDRGPNTLVGLGGDDTLTARAGNDTLAGGRGDDMLVGGRDSDFAEFYYRSPYVGSGDILAGPLTIDLVAGTAVGDGIDTLIDIESASGSEGDDLLVGDASDNSFLAYSGEDTVEGGDGADQVQGGGGADHLDGGAGTDLLSFEYRGSGITVDLSAETETDSEGDTLVGFEDVEGTDYDDIITGSDDPNWLGGWYGDDRLFGLGGDDFLYGEVGTDSADGGGGTDVCVAETETACEADSAHLVGRRNSWSYAESDRYLLAVLVGMLREATR